MRFDFQRWLPTITDIASVTFVATCVLILAAVAGEARSPGMAANMLSPQMLLGLAVASGLVSLLGERGTPSVSARIGYVLIGVVVTVAAAFFAWNYFAPFAEQRVAFTVVSGVAAASLFITSYRSKKTV